MPIVRLELKNPLTLPRPIAAAIPDNSTLKLGRVSNKVKAAGGTSIQPGQKSWIRVISNKHGLYIIEPRNDLLNKHSISVPFGVVQVQTNRPFYLLLDKFVPQTYFIPLNMTVAHFMDVDDNLLLSSSLTICDFLGIIPEASKELEIDGDQLLAYELRRFQDLRPPPK